MTKKCIVLSGINLYNGGPLTIYIECLDEIVEKKLYEKYNFILFVHDCELFAKYYDYFEIIEIKDSRSSWLKRLYYEYIYFNKFSKKRKIFLWISLHDITPNVIAEHLITYCHNPTPFLKSDKNVFKFDKKVYLFSKFYKYLYSINIKKNDFIIVQQEWIALQFKEMFKISRIKVFPPRVCITIPDNKNSQHIKTDVYSFIYPALPRPFKNFEVIGEAVRQLEDMNLSFKVYLTIDGTENAYASYIVNKYQDLKSIEFIGLQERQTIYDYYLACDCLLFPSKLETWGLPISEAEQYNLPILVAKLPYANETVGNYDKVDFFLPDDERALAKLMKKNILKQNEYEGNSYMINQMTKVYSWHQIINIINGGIDD